MFAVLFAGFLIPIGLAVLLVVRLNQAEAKSRADLVAFAERLGLKGTVTELFSLAGTYDGLPLYVSRENVRGDRGMRPCVRVRLLRGDPGGYRDGHATTAPALAVRRSAALPAVDLITGLHDPATGDAVFDADFRGFVVPGEVSPWADAAVRSALVRMPDRLELVQRSVAECAATFSGSKILPEVLERIVQVLASLASSERSPRHRAELLAPFDASPPREDVRARWAGLRFALVSILGFMAMAPLMFTNMANDWAGDVACKKGEHLTMVSNGRGASARCTDKHGKLGESVDGTLFLVSVDTGWVAALAVFSVFEMAIRLAKRRAAA